MDLHLLEDKNFLEREREHGLIPKQKSMMHNKITLI